VTQNTDLALWQPTNFGLTPAKILHSRRKFSKILPFCTFKGDLTPMSRILHSALAP
jgi:hypothetical protein